jgi:hypothetical protein
MDAGRADAAAPPRYPSPVPTVTRPARRPARHPVLASLAVVGVLVLALPFTLHALGLGWAGLLRDLWPDSRFDPPGTPLSAAIFAHMLAGALITVLAPVQLLTGAHAPAPRLHRWTGRLLVAAALVTALGGLAWIAGQGTVGGPPMSAGFALYGALMALAAGQTLRFARARAWARHRAWALRLVVLALASWLYRVHYTLWYLATGGAASNADFTGAFDRVQVLAFFLPYLLALEMWLRRARRRARRATSG